jgi:hypothetical protein
MKTDKSGQKPVQNSIFRNEKTETDNRSVLSVYRLTDKQVPKMVNQSIEVFLFFLTFLLSLICMTYIWHDNNNNGHQTKKNSSIKYHK